MERMSANGLFFHRNCFKCSHCNCKLKMGNYSLSKGEGGEKGKFFCSVHYRQLFMSNPEAINYSRADAPKREQSKTDLPAEKEKSTQQMNGKPEQEMTKSTSVEDAAQRTEQVHISIEEETGHSSELTEKEAEMLSGDEHRELNGDLPTDDMPPEDPVFKSGEVEKEVTELEEETAADLLANEVAGDDDLLEDEVGIANRDDLEEVTSSVNVKLVKLDRAPQQVTAEQLASVADISIDNSSTCQFSCDESEEEPTSLAVDKQVASPSHEPEKPTGVSEKNTCILPCPKGDESEKIAETARQEIIPQIEDELSIIMEKPETSFAHSGDKSGSEMTTNLAEVAPEEGEQTNKTVTTEKLHVSCIPSRRESDKMTELVTLSYESDHQNDEPKQPTCTIQTPTQQMRVMLIVCHYRSSNYF